MGTSDLIELVKALTSRDEKDKPKTKEAEVIKLNNMPAPESYRNWKNHVRDEVKSCSDRPDEAWAWLNDVYDQTCTRQELEAKLQDPGKFLTLDTKLSAALTRSAGGDLATRILNYKEQQSRKGIQVRGRYVLLMFEDYFKTSEEAGSLYRVEDLLGVVKVGDSVQDLRRFVNIPTLPSRVWLQRLKMQSSETFSSDRSAQVTCLSTTLKSSIVQVKSHMKSRIVFSISP